MNEILRNSFDQCRSQISSEELLCTMDSFVFVMLVQKLTTAQSAENKSLWGVQSQMGHLHYTAAPGTQAPQRKGRKIVRPRLGRIPLKKCRLCLTELSPSWAHNKRLWRPPEDLHGIKPTNALVVTPPLTEELWRVTASVGGAVSFL